MIRGPLSTGPKGNAWIAQACRSRDGVDSDEDADSFKLTRTVECKGCGLDENGKCVQAPQPTPF